MIKHVGRIKDIALGMCEPELFVIGKATAVCLLRRENLHTAPP